MDNFSDDHPFASAPTKAMQAREASTRRYYTNTIGFLDQLEVYDDGRTFLSRLWRKIWDSTNASFERNQSIVSNEDLKDHVLVIINELEYSHPDFTILRPLLPALRRSDATETDPLVSYIVRLARIILYTTTSHRDKEAPSKLLDAALHLNTILDVHLQFDLAQVNKVTPSNSNVCRAYLRLIVTTILHDCQRTAGLKESHYKSVIVVKNTVRHWPGTLSEESLRKVACFCSKVAIKSDNCQSRDEDHQGQYTGSLNESLLDQDIEKCGKATSFVGGSQLNCLYRIRRIGHRCLRTFCRVLVFAGLFAVFLMLSLLLIYSVGA
jgi:hypothetical protein